MAEAKSSAPRAPHDDVDERIRRDAAAHPERSYREHVAAAEEIAAEQYRRDLSKISPAAWDAYYRDLEADELEGV